MKSRACVLKCTLSGIMLLLFMPELIMVADAAVYVLNSGESIQEAVDSANSGDTIIVNSGTYHEAITLNKSGLVLRGNDSGSGYPAINAGGSNGIAIEADGCVVENFHITKSSCGISVTSDNNIIRGNNASLNDNGIGLVNSENNMLVGNTINSNGKFGMIMQFSHNNTFVNNIARENGGDAFVVHDSDNNTLVGNNLISNGDDGIDLASSDYNVLEDNIAQSNSWFGVNLENCCYNKFVKNSIVSNHDYGMYMYYSTNNTLENNNVSSNGYYGFRLQSAEYNELIHNTASSNKDTGILIRESNYNIFEENIVNSNAENGFEIAGNSGYNLFTNNIAVSNERFGLYMEFSYNNTFSGNVIYGNLNGDFYGDFYPNTWSTGSSGDIYGNLFQKYIAENSEKTELYYKENGAEWIKYNKSIDSGLPCPSVPSDDCYFYTIEAGLNTPGSLDYGNSQNAVLPSGEQIPNTSDINDSKENTSEQRMSGFGGIMAILPVMAAFLLKRRNNLHCFHF